MEWFDAVEFRRKNPDKTPMEDVPEASEMTENTLLRDLKGLSPKPGVRRRG